MDSDKNVVEVRYLLGGKLHCAARRAADPKLLLVSYDISQNGADGHVPTLAPGLRPREPRRRSPHQRSLADFAMGRRVLTMGLGDESLLHRGRIVHRVADGP